jgi:hypothetical protein
MGAFLCGIGFTASAYLLVRAIRTFRRHYRVAEVARAAALPQQTIRIPTAGELRLFLEGPRFRTWGKRLTYAMSEESTGRSFPITPSYSGSGVRSTTRSRVERGRFTLSTPGAYVLQVGGLEPHEAPEYAVVIMRPFFGKLLAFILSCVFLGMILIGSLIGAILFLALS